MISLTSAYDCFTYLVSRELESGKWHMYLLQRVAKSLRVAANLSPRMALIFRVQRLPSGSHIVEDEGPGPEALQSSS